MSKKYNVISVLALLIVALVLFADTSSAQTTGQPYHYTSYTAKCAEYPPEAVWVTGQIVHIRGMVSTGKTFGDPYFTGEFENTLDLDMNMVTGEGSVRGSIVITPDAYDGTWQDGHYAGHLHNFVFSGVGIEYGTGELDGMKDLVFIQDIDPDELPTQFQDPCNGGPVLGANLAHGSIIER